MRLISSMLSIIYEPHVGHVVDNPLNIRSIDHIGRSMLQHKLELCPEKGTDAWRRHVVKNS
jgi:hypothetical protein